MNIVFCVYQHVYRLNYSHNCRFHGILSLGYIQCVLIHYISSQCQLLMAAASLKNLSGL